MIDKYCILIDERDQSRNLRSIKRTLKVDHGINFNYVQINPSENKFQSMDEGSDVPRVDMRKIEDEIKTVPFFMRANTIAIDYNLVEDVLNGFQVGIVVRKLGYKINKEIIIYSAGIEKAIESIIQTGKLEEMQDKIHQLVKGKFNFIKREGYENEIIKHIRQEPAYNFDIVITEWLHRFSERQIIAIFPAYKDYTLGQIAQEIEANTLSSQEFRKHFIEFAFSILVDDETA
ncbi:hypothetical protein [Flavobacterium subsaxonicum]|uniref:Uncharacterized protein n=1 Tax=Flavobacterium subsaxonicum WB 4.1-42 = DSM 21790 TaxID=1121898 RepID=A0A0A2MN96_9FLAO|nr:hypothetical protein [Flavobacterium subsaxonicum]KGO93789.1 hypothetical protein Q766_07575 [Flavobacterium subsaxonicum WB 4.1-42 = DSM 21790]